MHAEPSADDPDDEGDVGADALQSIRGVQNAPTAPTAPAPPTAPTAPGDDEELAALCAQHLPLLIAFFLRRNCGADADDLAADVMMSFVQYRQRYPDVVVANVSAFLRQSARHQFADYVRQKQAERDRLISIEQRRERDDRDDDDWLSAQVVERPRGHELEVMSEALAGEMFDEIMRLIPCGSSQAICELVIEGGHSVQDIATRVGVSPRRVWNVMSRFRARLEKLHPEWAEGRRLRGPQRGTRHTDTPPDSPAE